MNTHTTNMQGADTQATMQAIIQFIGDFNFEMMAMAVRLSLDGYAIDLAPPIDEPAILQEYHYAKKTVALWRYYRDIGQIGRQANVAMAVWWFIKDSDVSFAEDLPFDKIDGVPVVLSGQPPLGTISALANRLHEHGHGVYYVPLLFIKDGDDLASLSAPRFVMVGAGQKITLAPLQTLLDSAKSVQIDTIKTVEFAKSLLLAMLAARLSFVNELAPVAQHFGVDMARAVQLMASDGRVGDEYLSPSWGFGGHSLPNNAHDLLTIMGHANLPSPMMSATMAVNDAQKEWLFCAFWRYYGGQVEHKRVLIWGAGYRRGTGRTQGSAVFVLIELLLAHQNTVYVYSPQAQDSLRAHYQSTLIDEALIFVTNPYRMDLDALFLLNPDAIDIARLANMQVPIFDGKNALGKDDIAHLKADYHGVGRTYLYSDIGSNYNE